MQQIIRTARLTLRPLLTDDAAAFSRMAGRPEVARMTGSFPSPFDSMSVEGRIQIFLAQEACGGGYHRAVTRDGALLGVVGGGFVGAGSFDFGYWLGEDHWGRGYGTESVAAFLDAFARVHPDRTLQATVFTDNPASRRLLETIGFALQPGTQPSYSIARRRQDPAWSLTREAPGLAIPQRTVAS